MYKHVYLTVVFMLGFVEFLVSLFTGRKKKLRTLPLYISGFERERAEDLILLSKELICVGAEKG